MQVKQQLLSDLMVKILMKLAQHWDSISLLLDIRVIS